jgi:uncharacterized membrane protein
VWAPDGRVFQLSTPEGDQSHAVWINDFGQVSGWIENETPDPCFAATTAGTKNQSQAVLWEFGYMRRLGTLGGTNSYGEFINDLGQVSGHSETSTVPNPVTQCPPFDPFIWQNGKLIDINPGNFGGAEGGTNFLSNGGYAVGYGTTLGRKPRTRSSGTTASSRTFLKWATWVAAAVAQPPTQTMRAM